MTNKSRVFIICFILTFSSALLFALANPNAIFPDGLGFLAWIAFVPLFFAVEMSSLKNCWLFGFLYGSLAYGMYVYWLWNFNIPMFFISIVFYGISHALLFFVLRLATLWLGNFAWLSHVFILTAFEYLRSLGFFGFSFGGIGYTQWKNILLIQIANLGGVYSISFLIYFCSGLIFAFIKKLALKKELSEFEKNESHSTAYSPLQLRLKIDSLSRKASLKILVLPFFLWTCALGFALLYGYFSHEDYSSNTKITFAAIQNNEKVWDDGIDVYFENLNRLQTLTDEALDLNPYISVVVWPETAITPSIYKQYYFGRDENRIRYVDTLLDYINRKNCLFVIGNYHSVPDKNGNFHDYNTSMVFQPRKNVIPPNAEIYAKMHLVPLVEDFPWKDKMPKIAGFLEKNGAHFWEAGREYKVFEYLNLFFSTPICFEDNFPDLCRKMCLAGSRCFVNLSSDGWAKSKAAQTQHMAMAVFRSVENKIPSVRSCTTGETCIINPDGRIFLKTEPFTESYVIADVPVISVARGSTFYCKFGDYLPATLGICAFVMLLIGAIHTIIKKARE